MKFIYNGKQYETPDLEKKLKRMKISKDDIQIIEDVEIIPEKVKEENKIKTYHFKNIKTGEIISSIYNTLDDLDEIINIDDYERID